jgi:hypothetical protein
VGDSVRSSLGDSVGVSVGVCVEMLWKTYRDSLW